MINVAYYLATVAARGAGPVDPAEVSEVRWFAWDELPAELAPPGTLEAVLTVARRARDGRHASSPLPDRPT